jgi:hypothetical protein
VGKRQVYTDGLRAYNPLTEDEQFDGEYVAHGDGEYAEDIIHMKTCESHMSLRDGGSRCIEVSQKIALDSIFGRSYSDQKSTAIPDEKRSNTPSKQLPEINNVLNKSTNNYDSIL